MTKPQIKICIVTALNERPKVSRIMLMCADRLGLDVIAGTHTVEDYALVESYGQIAINFRENHPAEKFSRVLFHAVTDDRKFTHFLIMGDDDSLSTQGLCLLMDAAEKGIDYCGFRRNGYLHVKSWNASHHRYNYKCDKLIGAGRLLSRKAVEATTNFAEVLMTRDFMEYKQGQKYTIRKDIAEYMEGYHYAKITLPWIARGLWDVKRRNGLDDYSEKKLVAAGFIPVAVDDDRIHVTDFKVMNNIWQFDMIRNTKPINHDEVLWFLDKVELEYIQHLKEIVK